MNLIIAITLAITIAWLQCATIAAALVNTRRGQFQSVATYLNATTLGNSPSESKRELLFKNEIGGGYPNSAKVTRLEVGHKIDATRVIPPVAQHKESTTTARPSQDQIPRPAVVSRPDSTVWA